MTAIAHVSDMLSQAVEAYLAARYPDANLTDLSKRGIQHDDEHLARMLYDWRRAGNWSQPHVIGEARCVHCTKVMGDEASVCEDEILCAKCGETTLPPDPEISDDR